MLHCRVAPPAVGVVPPSAPVDWRQRRLLRISRRVGRHCRRCVTIHPPRSQATKGAWLQRARAACQTGGGAVVGATGSCGPASAHDHDATPHSFRRDNRRFGRGRVWPVGRTPPDLWVVRPAMRFRVRPTRVRSRTSPGVGVGSCPRETSSRESGRSNDLDRVHF
jgi:hypothetical protein